jgi:hypothetical protein
MTETEALDLYTRTLNMMSEVVNDLRDEPDPDGTFADLADRIEAERAWVRALMALGEEPRRPPGWLRCARAPLLH